MWMLITLINALVYVGFVWRRGEAGWLWSVVLALVLGPLVWFVRLAQRAGRSRSQEPITAAPCATAPADWQAAGSRPPSTDACGRSTSCPRHPLPRASRSGLAGPHAS
jgi:hypothetical protein